MKGRSSFIVNKVILKNILTFQNNRSNNKQEKALTIKNVYIQICL